MNDSQQLREAVWDLVYGLLSDEESQALIARIKSDPQAARIYAEVRLQADLVSAAARIEDSSLVFQVDRAASGVAANPANAPAPAKSPTSAPVSRGALQRGGTWLAGIAATSLIALLAVGFWWPHPDQRQLARAYLAADLIAQ